MYIYTRISFSYIFPKQCLHLRDAYFFSVELYSWGQEFLFAEVGSVGSLLARLLGIPVRIFSATPLVPNGSTEWP